MANKKKYQFDRKTQNQLKNSMEWLQKKGYAKSTTSTKTKYIGYFLGWMGNENIRPEMVSYNDLLTFIDHCKSEGDKNELINRKLLSVRKFYEYLQEKDPNLVNPAISLQIRGTVNKIPSNLLDIKELETLYNTHITKTLRDKRNKTILGLFIFQGIATEDLHGLETTHLDLEQGKIKIPGNRRINSRVLELKPFQVMELYKYVHQLRAKIIENLTNPGRIPENKLFFSMKGSSDMVSSLLAMFKEIQKIKPEVKNAYQIRASVITNWLKTNNLRMVQYMAGHKYVSSTERYQLDNLENLQKELEKYHPLS